MLATILKYVVGLKTKEKTVDWFFSKQSHEIK